MIPAKSFSPQSAQSLRIGAKKTGQFSLTVLLFQCEHCIDVCGDGYSLR